MIIVTGAAGFIGSNIAGVLAKAGHDVVAVDDLSFGNPVNIPDGVSFIKQDFANVLPQGGGQNDILVHCATSNIIYAQDFPLETFINNAVKTIELFRRFRGKIVYTSTSSVYGDAKEFPTPEGAPMKTYNAYDTSKRIAEMYLSLRGEYTTLRLSNVYGKNQLSSNPYCGIIGKLIYCALNNKTFHIYGNGNDTRDYTYIDDVVEALQKAIFQGSKFTEINIGTGEETSVNELIRLVSHLTGKTIHAVTVDKRGIDNIGRRCLDVGMAFRTIGWKPKTHIGEGLMKTIEWYKNAGQLVNI